MLAGCASGEILGKDATDAADKSFISVSPGEGESIWIRRLYDDSHRSVKLEAPGIWVSSGWFEIEYFCTSPKNRPGAIIIEEDNDEKPIHIGKGHNYRLACDDDKPFLINLVETQ